MGEFNYTEYLRNNPLLKKEGKNKLIKENALGFKDSRLTPKQHNEVRGDKKYTFGNDPYADDQLRYQKAKELGYNVDEITVGTKMDVDDYKNMNQNQISDAYAGIVKDMTDGIVTLGFLVDQILPEKGKELFNQLELAWEDFTNYFEYGDQQDEEITESSSKMKVSELKSKIREDILSILSEADDKKEDDKKAKDEEPVDEEPIDDAEVDMEMGDAEMDMGEEPTGGEGLTADEKEIQDSLKLAYDNAVKIDSPELANQIGNIITFFTRKHVVER